MAKKNKSGGGHGTKHSGGGHDGPNRGRKGRGGHNTQSRQTKGIRNEYDGSDYDYDMEIGSVNVQVSYGNQGRRFFNPGLGLDRNNERSKGQFNNSNRTNRFNKPNGIFTRDPLISDQPDPDAPKPYTKSKSPYVVPIVFVKSDEPYNPSKQINEYLESRRKREQAEKELNEVDQHLVSSETGLKNLRIESTEIVVDSTEISIATTDETNEKAEIDNSDSDSDGSDDDLENLIQFAKSDIGGEGEGMSYDFNTSIEEMKELNDLIEEDADDETQLWRNIHSAFFIYACSDSEEYWKGITGSLADGLEHQLTFETEGGYEPLSSAKYKDLRRVIEKSQIPPFANLVSIIKTQGRYHSILDDKAYDNMVTKKQEEELLAVAFDGKDHENKDKKETKSSSDEDIEIKSDKEPESTSKEQTIAEMISQLADQQDSRKKSKSARRIEREQQERLAKDTDSAYNSTRKKFKKGKLPDFSAADPMLHDELASQFETARKNQALKKMERKLQRDLAKTEAKIQHRTDREKLLQQEIAKKVTEELLETRRQMLEPKNGYVNLSYKYPVYMTVLDVVRELENFILNVGRKTLPFPNMSPSDMDRIRDLATCYKLDHKLKGGIVDPHLTVLKDGRETLLSVDHKTVFKILDSEGTFKLWNLSPKVNPTLITPKMHRKMKLRNLEKMAFANLPAKNKVRVFDGHVVGSNAEAIAENNTGHQLLRKLGWSKGTGLGPNRSGIEEPLLAIVKITKLGLGNKPV